MHLPMIMKKTIYQQLWLPLYKSKIYHYAILFMDETVNYWMKFSNEFV